MEREEIKERIISILEEKVVLRSLEVEVDRMPLNEEGLGLDSLCFLKALTEIEKEFKIKIEDDYWDFSMFQTLNDIVEYCYKSLNS